MRILCGEHSPPTRSNDRTRGIQWLRLAQRVAISNVENDRKLQAAEQSDGPKRWIGRFLMENLLATAAVIGGVTPMCHVKNDEARRVFET